MIRNKDFALLYAGRAAFNKNGEYAGVVVGWNDMHGVILGVDHVNGWQSWGANDIGVSEEHGGVKPVSMGDGLENVSSKIWEEKVWGEKVWKR